MKVLVIGANGIGLMPTTPAKARKLLEAGKADVAQRYPFTIRLPYKTGSATQQCRLGIDTGESHIGAAVTSGTKVLRKDEYSLRKSMEKRKLMETRKSYRRGRRYRKARYRHPKFRFRTKRVYSEIPDKKGRHWKKVPNKRDTGRGRGWLPPSIESKKDHHINIVRKYQRALPKNTVTVIEVARFDIQHMMDPAIRGELYQQGRMYGYENVKAYILAKYNYTCPICKHKFDKDHKPRKHHLTMKKNGATDNPDEYAPVCTKCHSGENHLPDHILGKLAGINERKEYREPTFMNILRKRLFKAFPDAEFSYGNITNADRKLLGLGKSHANDAVAIALHGVIKDMGGAPVKIQDDPFVTYVQQVRSKKRQLHEATPRKGRNGKKNRNAERNNKNVKEVRGFRLCDTVRVPNGDIGYISGFTGLSAYVQDLDGNYLAPAGKNYRQQNLSGLVKIRQNYNWVHKTAFIPSSKANGISA